MVSSCSFPGQQRRRSVSTALMAVDKDFYGIFSANNTPKKSNFPNGVVYQRNANWTSNTFLGVDNTKPVRISIDPFFFQVTG